MVRQGKTLIQISLELADFLKSKRLTHRDTYEEVIARKFKWVKK